MPSTAQWSRSSAANRMRHSMPVTRSTWRAIMPRQLRFLLRLRSSRMRTWRDLPKKPFRRFKSTRKWLKSLLGLAPRMPRAKHGSCRLEPHRLPRNLIMPSQDAISLLQADHRKVEQLFEQFEASEGAQSKGALVQQICTELTVHTVLEEEFFYPACKGEVDDELLNEAYVEHDGAKVLIAELLESDPSDEFYDAKVKVLSEQIEHHVEEEEKPSEGIFAQARKAGLDLDRLAKQMQERKVAMMGEIRADGVPNPETRTFSGHSLEQGQPVEGGPARD